MWDGSEKDIAQIPLQGNLARTLSPHMSNVAVNTTPKRGGMTGGLEGRKRSQRLKDAGFHFVQAPVV